MRPLAIIMCAAAVVAGEDKPDVSSSRGAAKQREIFIRTLMPKAAKSAPSYKAGTGPKVYFDEGHHEIFVQQGWHGMRKRIEEPIGRDGYGTITFSSSFSRENLKSCDILVVIVAQPEKSRDFRAFPHPSAFNRKEIDELVLWIHEGGSLFLITEHTHFAGYVADLAYLLGVQLFDGSAHSCQAERELEDDESGLIVFGTVATDKWREYARQWNMPFERYARILSNPGTLGKHPIVQGRNGAESLKTVVTHDGSAFRTSKEWAPIMTLGPSAVGEVQLDRNFEGGDLQDHKFPLDGWQQSAARRFGKGRVVLQADWNPVYNPQYTLNVIHWLSGLLDPDNSATPDNSE